MRKELEEKIVKEFPFLEKNSEQREEDRIDKAVINSSDLDKLQSGLIYYSYSFKSPNAMFNDAYYDEVVKGQTNYYLK